MNQSFRIKPHVVSVVSARSASQLQQDLIFPPPQLPSIADDDAASAQIGSASPPREFDPRKETLEEFFNIRFGPEMPTIHDDKKPERDLKNFPRRVFPLWPEKTRLHLIPDSWFQMFYNKTGVTGPYVFGVSFITFLLSKEIYVIEHEFVVGCSLLFLTWVGMKKFGPQTRNFLNSTIDVSFNKHANKIPSFRLYNAHQ